MRFKRLLSKIIIPFLIVIFSALVFFNILEHQSVLVRPMTMVYYGVLLGSFLTIYFWIVDD